MGELKVFVWMTEHLPQQLPFLVALFGWMLTAKLWKEDRDYHRSQYRQIADRHDQERKRFVEALEKVNGTMDRMKELIMEVKR